MILASCSKSPHRGARRPSSIEQWLLHAGAEGHVFVFSAVPEEYGGCLVAAGFFGEDSHDRFVLLDGQFFHDYLLKGQIHDEELRFRSGGMPSFGAGSVNYQQRVASALWVIRGELRGDLGIAVAKEAVVGIDDDEAIFGLVHHWIGAARRDDYVFNAIIVQVSDQGIDSDQRASRSELLLDEVIVDGGLGRRRHGRWLRGRREA